MKNLELNYFLRPMQLILYTKPGCHLCEGLQKKLEKITTLEFQLEVRDITSREDWFAAYEYEVPVLCQNLDGKIKPLPGPCPRTSVPQLERMIQNHTEAEAYK